jgi:hypothetical protein
MTCLATLPNPLLRRALLLPRALVSRPRTASSPDSASLPHTSTGTGTNTGQNTATTSGGVDSGGGGNNKDHSLTIGLGVGRIQDLHPRLGNNRSVIPCRPETNKADASDENKAEMAIWLCIYIRAACT